MTEKSIKALRAKFGREFADDFVKWLHALERAAVALPRPSKKVSEVLGDDLVDEVLDWIVTVRRAR